MYDKKIFHAGKFTSNRCSVIAANHKNTAARVSSTITADKMPSLACPETSSNMPRDARVAQPIMKPTHKLERAGEGSASRATKNMTPMATNSTAPRRATSGLVRLPLNIGRPKDSASCPARTSMERQAQSIVQPKATTGF